MIYFNVSYTISNRIVRLFSGREILVMIPTLKFLTSLDPYRCPQYSNGNETLGDITEQSGISLSSYSFGLS